MHCYCHRIEVKDKHKDWKIRLGVSWRTKNYLLQDNKTRNLLVKYDDDDWRFASP